MLQGADYPPRTMRRSPVPPQMPPSGQEVRFSDAQQEALAEALFRAEVALLDAVVAEAKRAEAFDGPRKVGQLAQALSMLRFSAGQQPMRGPMAGPWVGPFGPMMHSVGSIDIDEDDELDDE